LSEPLTVTFSNSDPPSATLIQLHAGLEHLLRVYTAPTVLGLGVVTVVCADTVGLAQVRERPRSRLCTRDSAR
jgi:hypothetical protein